jgi:hypothetical protein
MAFEALDAAADAVEPPRQRGLQSIGAVRREMRGERRFDDERLGYLLVRGIIRELAGEVRRQAECMLRAHLLEAHIVRGIETRLARDVACAALKGAEAYSIVVALLIRLVELMDRSRRLRRDLLVLGQFWLPADA